MESDIRRKLLYASAIHRSLEVDFGGRDRLRFPVFAVPRVDTGGNVGRGREEVDGKLGWTERWRRRSLPGEASFLSPDIGCAFAILPVRISLLKAIRLAGLHASISIHICDEYLDQATGEWSPNLDCFVTRIAEHPERLQNVYFTYVVALRALAKAGPELVRALEETAGDNGVAGDARKKLQDLTVKANGCPSTFDESSMFSGAEAEVRPPSVPFSVK